MLMLQKFLIIVIDIIALTLCFTLGVWILSWIFEGTSIFNPTTIIEGFVFSIIYLPIQYWLSKRTQKKR